MKVSVFGLGYVGCVTAGCLAARGHRVIGVDVSADKVAMVNAGTSPIIEPGLGELLTQVVGTGALSATTSAAEAIAATDLALICVGTPDSRSGRPNLEALTRVASDIGAALSGRTRDFVVVVRSTVLPGTIEGVVAPAVRASAHPCAGPLTFASNPEFMREGCSLQDFDHPPFVLVGSDAERTATAVQSLYIDVSAPVVHTTVRTAEMVKYVCNAFHALKVCFSNEVGDLCQALGADAHEVMRIFRLDRKLNVSEAYLKPGFAFGGSCLPKDVRALVAAARANDLAVPLLSAVMPANDGQIARGLDEVLDTHKQRIGIVGLAFKPGTDDLRESPMVALVERLIGKGRDVRIFDPRVSMAQLVGANKRFIETEIPHIASLLCSSVDDLVAHAEVLVFSAPGPDADRALQLATSEQMLLDLTRGMVCKWAFDSAQGRGGRPWETTASVAT
jgi:GDP-mannose 6-dehydrogenase